MDKLSELIQQARPLYKQRQRRKKIATMLFSITIPIIAITNMASLYLEGDAFYMALDNNKVQDQLISDDFGILGLE